MKTKIQRIHDLLNMEDVFLTKPSSLLEDCRPPESSTLHLGQKIYLDTNDNDDAKMQILLLSLNWWLMIIKKSSILNLVQEPLVPSIPNPFQSWSNEGSHLQCWGCFLSWRRIFQIRIDLALIVLGDHCIGVCNESLDVFDDFALPSQSRTSNMMIMMMELLMVVVIMIMDIFSN